MPPTVQTPTNRKYDRIFFPVFTLLILIAVYIGFARTYYAAGMILAPLPNVLIHIHGAVFTLWLVLLVAQTGLVSARRTDIHKKLGLWGFGLTVLMVIAGVLAGTDQLRRGGAPPGFPLGPQVFYVVPITSILLFAFLIFRAYKARFNPGDHKRLITIATVDILGAAIGRWQFAFLQRSHFYPDMCEYAFLVLIACYDVFSTGRVQKVTLWASALVIVVEQIRIPLAMTPAWHAFAGMMAKTGI